MSDPDVTPVTIVVRNSDGLHLVLDGDGEQEGTFFPFHTTVPQPNQASTPAELNEIAVAVQTYLTEELTAGSETMYEFRVVRSSFQDGYILVEVDMAADLLDSLTYMAANPADDIPYVLIVTLDEIRNGRTADNKWLLDTTTQRLLVEFA